MRTVQLPVTPPSRAAAVPRAALPLALAGGLLTRGSLLRKRLEHRLRSAVPGAQVRANEVDPARGAVRGALRYVGVEIP